MLYNLTENKIIKYNIMSYKNENDIIETIRKKSKGEPDWLVGISNNLISEKLAADKTNNIDAIEKANSRLESFNIDLDGFNEMTTEQKQKPHIVEFTKERYKPIDNQLNDSVSGAKNNSFENSYESLPKKKNQLEKNDYNIEQSNYTTVLYSNDGGRRRSETNRREVANFDYNTRLSYNQQYNKNVELLQCRLSKLGYLDMSGGGWGYYGKKTIDAVNRYKADKGLGNTGDDYGVVGKQTWNSLGLKCREQKDIDNGVEILTIDNRQYFDVTKPLTKNLFEIADIAKSKRDDNIASKGWWFFNQVYHDRPWDIKLRKP